MKNKKTKNKSCGHFDILNETETISHKLELEMSERETRGVILKPPLITQQREKPRYCTD